MWDGCTSLRKEGVGLVYLLEEGGCGMGVPPQGRRVWDGCTSIRKEGVGWVYLLEEGGCGMGVPP